MRAFTTTRAKMADCPTRRMDAEHYRDDGTCRCHPIRIQYKRGHALPEGAKLVARPTRWGNPWKIEPGVLTAKEAVELYEILLESHETFRANAIRHLRGFDLACYCPLDQVHCHADALLRVVNA
jgi:hypothetical protein